MVWDWLRVPFDPKRRGFFQQSAATAALTRGTGGSDTSLADIAEATRRLGREETSIRNALSFFSYPAHDVINTYYFRGNLEETNDVLSAIRQSHLKCLSDALSATTILPDEITAVDDGTDTITLGKLREQFKRWNADEGFVASAIKSSKLAIDNFEALKRWFTAAERKMPADTLQQLQCCGYDPRSILGSIAQSYPHTLSSPEITEALALPPTDPRKYRLLQDVFVSRRYSNEDLENMRTGLEKMGVALNIDELEIWNSGPSGLHECLQTIAPEGLQVPRPNHLPEAEDYSPTPPSAICKDLETLLKTSVTYNPETELYETNLRAIPATLNRLRSLVRDNDDALSGLKEENINGAITICLNQDAADALGSVGVSLDNLQKAQAIAWVQGDAPRSR